MENKDTQLPADVLEEMKAKATAYMHAEIKGMVGDDELQPHHLKYAHEAGATEYATKLHQARALLEKVIYRHEGGLLPDRLLYNEIKTFLDGAK